MKRGTIIFLFFVALVQSISAQYNCSKFYPFEAGAKAKYHMFDKDGTMQGSVEYAIERIFESASGPSAIMTHKLADSFGNQISGSEYQLICTDHGVQIDFNSLVRPGLLSRIGTDYEITGTNVEIPNDLAVGDILNDAGMLISFNMHGNPVTMSMSITNRKVITMETVSTPAGTFPCFVLTQKMEMNMGAVFMTSSKQWISEGVGLIKQEDYDEGGNLTSVIVLQSFEN